MTVSPIHSTPPSHTASSLLARTEEPVPSRILCVGAHPDDIDFGAAATIAKWTAAGATVAYCLVTDGDAGGFDPTVDRSEIPRIRREEQTAAARVVGVDELYFLGYPDGRLIVSLELRRDISRIIRKFKPERVVCQSPERNWERIFASHPDHLAAGEATLCAVYPDARNRFAFTELMDEGLEPHAVTEVWLAASPSPNTFVEVSETFEFKLQALRAHVSQETDVGGILEARMREWLSAGAKMAGLADGALAESFRRIATG